MDYDEACFMHLTPGVVHTFPKAVGVKDSDHMHKKDPRLYRAAGKTEKQI